ncbi:MAG: hypothetical protein KAX13_10585, partial [Candidatus Krumholzibacteria bacterium]|nr:hypothetical protein [Candidatus Krumholzibacteria bacterium]
LRVLDIGLYHIHPDHFLVLTAESFTVGGHTYLELTASLFVLTSIEKPEGLLKTVLRYHSNETVYEHNV